MRSKVLIIYLLFFGGLGLSACQGETVDQVTQDVFRPPTLEATPLPPDLPTPTQPPPSATPTCEDNLIFLEDITIPDGTVVLPGETLDKRWRVENNGTCNWDEAYRIGLVAGSAMGAEIEQALFPARSGTEVEIRIIFTAPTEAGLVRSAWQAINPDGESFGDSIFIEVVVSDEPGPTDLPS